MTVLRIALTLGTIVSLSLAGCNSAVVPTTQPTGSSSTAPSPASSGAPSPSGSVAPSARAALWLDAGDLVEPRNATNVVVLGTGEILVVGSDYQTSWLATCGAATGGSDSVELGDPQTGVWEKTTSLPSPREAPVLVALQDGRALLTGGETGEEGGPTAYSSTYVFDPTARSWARSGLLNTARTGTSGAVLADGRVLVAGGLYTDRTQNPRALDTSELWDPRSGAWSRTGRLAESRWGASSVTLADGRVLIVGGVASPESPPAERGSAEVYDPGSGLWSSAGTLATARSGFALVALADGGALVAGGFGGLGTTARAYLSTVERFDPVSNSWSAADDLPYPVAGASGIRLADGRVLLAGGSVRDPEQIEEETFASGLTADAVLFDAEAGTWTATTPMPGPRAGASAVLLADGSAVFAGGSADEGAGTPGCPIADPQVFRYVPGEPTRTPIAVIDHATGPTDIVLRFDGGGDYGICELCGGWGEFSPGPECTLYGDGTVIVRNGRTQLPPAEGPIIRAHPFMIAHRDEAQVATGVS